MIEFKTGNILEAKAEALVNTVNCVGVMGKGIALQFKTKFPDNFKAYELICKDGKLRPGKLFVYQISQLINPKYIVNFPTKDHWRAKSNLQDIEEGLKGLVGWIKENQIKSIAIPPLGCGNGGLDWKDVYPRIKNALESLTDVHVLVYEPKGTPFQATQNHGTAPQMTLGRAALLGLSHKYLSALMDPFLTLLEIHKLMYFMQESGEPLRLVYKKGPYGPYAENLRHVLKKIEGHFTTGFQDGDESPDKRIEINPAAASRALDFLEEHRDTQERFNRVAELVEGFETPFGMELLATVHWVAKDGAASLEDAISKTHAWSDRKRMFNADQIQLAWSTLQEKGWIH